MTMFDEPSGVDLAAAHAAATALLLQRAGELADRIQGPLGVQPAQLLAAQLDVQLANAHSLAALVLLDAPAEMIAVLRQTISVEVTPQVQAPRPSGLVVPNQ